MAKDMKTRKDKDNIYYSYISTEEQNGIQI